MSDASSKSSGGIGFFGLLAIVFITLKLCGIITWSWWWVTAPIWGPLALFIVFLAAAGIAIFAWEGIKEIRNRRVKVTKTTKSVTGRVIK